MVVDAVGRDAHRAQAPAHARGPGDAVRRRRPPRERRRCRPLDGRRARRRARPTSRCTLSRLDTATPRATRPTRGLGAARPRGAARLARRPGPPRHGGEARRHARRPAVAHRHRTAARDDDGVAARGSTRWAAEIHDERVARALSRGEPAPEPGTAARHATVPPEPGGRRGPRAVRRGRVGDAGGRRRRAAVRRPLRAVRHDDDRPRHPGQGPEPLRVARPAPALGRRGVVRHPDGPRARRAGSRSATRSSVR